MKKNLTEDGKARKQIICQNLIVCFTTTKLTLYFYGFGLEFLKEYVCLFQKKEPMIHLLHDQQLEVFRGLISCFIKPELIGDCTRKGISVLMNLDLIDEANHLSMRDILFGPTVGKMLKLLPI